MKGADPERLGGDAQERFDPRPHLRGGFISEGNGRYFLRGITGLVDQIADFLRDDSGFAATSTSQNQQRAI